MQSILDNPTPIEASSSESKNKFGAVAQQVNWLAIIEGMYSMLLLLLPVFFLPLTADPLNLNKAYLTVIVALVVLVLFFANGVQKGKLAVSNLTSYIGLSLLAIAAIVSVFFSINPDNSIFGHFGNYTDSLLFVVSLLVLGFVSSNVRLNFKKLLNALLIGTTASTVVSLYVLYGLVLPGIGELPRVFTLAGSVYILMGLQVIATLVSVYYLLSAETTKVKALYSAALILNALYLAIMLDPTALITLAVGLGVLFLYANKEFTLENKKVFVGILVALGVLAFVHHYPMTRDALGLNEMNTQPRLPLAESWTIVADTLKDRPLTGAGIGTFVNVFSIYRPASLNLTDNWQARFETPYSDVLLWGVSAGLVGLLAYALFVGFALNTVKNLDKSQGSSKLLALIIPVGLLALILLGTNPILYVLLFVALGAAIQKGSKNPLNINSVPVLAIFTLVAIAILGYVGLNAARIYAGQYYFRQSLFKDNLGERFQMQAKAIQADPMESVYQRSYISTGITIANVLAAQEDLSDESKQEILNILTQSFNNVRFLTEGFEPINVSNWSLRGDLYASIMDLTENADQLAVAAYSNAIQLEPTNPNLFINRGSVYYRRQVYAEAINNFAQAVNLKPDYANARYNLAYALKDAGYVVDAATQMEIVLRLVPEGTPDYEKAQADLEEFTALAEEAIAQAQAAAAQQSGAQVEDTTSQQTSTEPLVEPQDQPATQLENEDLEGVDEIVADDEVPAADGSQFNPENGETEAPIAQPAQ